MVYPIVVYGSPMLRKVSGKIDENYPGLKKLIDDMYETMEVSDGVGLAAPQIGKSIRMFILDTSPMADDDPSLDGFRQVFINPQIIEKTGDKWSYTEGCLSLPFIREDVDRPSKIHIRYYDANFEIRNEIYDGVKARIIQHEYDHLDGVLFIDKIAPLKKKLIKGKLNDIAKGKSKAAYKTKIIK